jgi:hypothetical protein
MGIRQNCCLSAPGQLAEGSKKATQTKTDDGGVSYLNLIAPDGASNLES